MDSNYYESKSNAQYSVERNKEMEVLLFIQQRVAERRRF